MIDITEAGFSPASVTISPGDEVRWVNRTLDRASVVSEPDGAQGLPGPPEGAEGFRSEPLREGETFARRLDAPGTYVFWSEEHAQQDWIGTIQVEESS